MFAPASLSEAKQRLGLMICVSVQQLADDAIGGVAVGGAGLNGRAIQLST